jgi:hypothetical protein
MDIVHDCVSYINMPSSRLNHQDGNNPQSRTNVNSNYQTEPERKENLFFTHLISDVSQSPYSFSHTISVSSHCGSVC